MKPQKRKAPAKPAPTAGFGFGYAAAALGAVLCLAFLVYGPALSGPPVFDDKESLSIFEAEFRKHTFASLPKGSRPLLMLGYLFNARVFGPETESFHVVNLLLHFGASLLAGLILRKLLEFAGVAGRLRDTLAVFAGALYLLHPLQTEAVAYIAGRSEAQSVFFFYAAFAVFLYRRSPAVSFPSALAVVALSAAAVLSKEHAAVLPALLLLTDYYWNPGLGVGERGSGGAGVCGFSLRGIWRNWRLYIPIAALAAAAGAFVWRVLRTAETAGFGVRDFTWQQYLYTQCRAVWVYIRLFFLPYGQNVDYAYPVSRNLLDRGAIAGGIALVALVGAAIWYRRRLPLASYGVLVFVLLIAPTSSFLPIVDPLVERRAYLPLIGLLALVCALAARLRVEWKRLAAALAAVLVVAGWLAWKRNQVWASEIALWEDSVRKAPHNERAVYHLARAYLDEQRCAEALTHFEQGARLKPADWNELSLWALAFECLGRESEALAKWRQAASIRREAFIYANLGKLYGKAHRHKDALEALTTAIQLDPGFEYAYIYRGNVYLQSREYAAALEDFNRALRINPANQYTRGRLALATPGPARPKP